MYFDELKQALRLDEKCSIENLNAAYKREHQSSNRKAAQEAPITYSLIELWANLEEEGLYREKSLDNKQEPSSDFGIDIDELIERIDRKIKELETNEKGKQGASLSEQKSNEIRIQELVPENTFSQAYKTQYLKACLWYFIEHYEENIIIMQQSDNWEQDFFKKIFFDGKSFLLSLIVRMITLGHEDRENFAMIAQSCKRHIMNSIVADSGKVNFTSDDLEQWRFFGQIILFIVMVMNGKARDRTSCEQEAISYIAYCIAKGLSMKKPSLLADIVLFAKKGLNITSPSDRQDAFNTLGVSAIEAGQKQLAYDTFYSWLHRRAVGELKGLIPDTLFLAGDDKKWRSESGREAEAVMLGNFAYVSGTISDTYEPNSERWKVFHDIAIKAVERAIELDEKSYNYHCTYGTLLSDNPEYDENNLLKALQQYYLYKENSQGAENKLDSFRVYCSVLLDVLSESFVGQGEKSFTQWVANQEVQRYLSIFNTELKKYAQYPEKDDTQDAGLLKAQKKRNSWQPYFKLQDTVEEYRTTPGIFDLELILLLIRNIANSLQIRLRRWEYNLTDYFSREGEDDQDTVRRRNGIRPIAYYTTLNTIKNIFDDLYQESPCQAPRKVKENEKGRNCLTVMHAKYMNDPHEGLTLLNEFLTRIAEKGDENILFPEQSPIQFRENIFNHQFIFLKSFTERIDNLLMWNRYASDYSAAGKNSNGCCVQLDAEVFGQLVDSSIDTETPIRLENASEDDYYLYRVVYVSRDGSIRDRENPGLPHRVREYYIALQSLIATLNHRLHKIYCKLGSNGDKLVEQVREFLQQTLRIILFLFKDSDYSDEIESRLIFVRTPNQQEEIRLLPTSPEKLCINPFFQVYISQIMFGPNVRDQELWTPYLQYQMNRMWRKHPSLADKPDILPNTCYQIVNSEIHYHT